MNCIRYICCIIGFIIALPVVSKSSGFISEVDSALARGEYEKAIRGYSELLEKEGSSPAIYINLSNAYHSFGDDGLSMVALLKGKKLDSFNKKINNNLLYLRNSISAANKSLNKDRKVDIQTDSPTFFENVKKLLITDFSPNIWAGWGAITFILFIG
ncbi:MAG: tetratricopeptide repeat protein, partial [Muribaculaceae bacterium]|nr:tetratricopeptide repeat protein [Muribaculaceae bacterium]